MKKKEAIIKCFKNFIVLIMSGMVPVLFCINMNKDIPLLESLEGNSICLVSIFIVIYWLQKRIIKNENKRAKAFGFCLAIILAICEVIGKSIDIYDNLSGILSSKSAILKSVIVFFGYLTMFFTILTNIFLKFDEIKSQKGDYSFFTNNKKSFFLVWGIIFIAWLPYFLNYFPGKLTIDSVLQVYQSLFKTPLTNHHPILHTLIIAIPMNIGSLLRNNNIGVAMYSILQMLALSATFSWAIYYMAKKNVSLKVRIVAFIFYAFYPVNGIYSITMWKDIPFAISMTIFTTILAELTINQDEFFKQKRKLAALVVSMILTMLLRNNGLYVVILTIPFMFIIAKKYYKSLLVVSIIVLAFYGIWKGPVFSILNIEEGSAREALSIPLQQFARISKYESDRLSQEEKDMIYKYLPVENLGEKYNSHISDTVKDNFDNQAFKEDKIDLVKLYFKLAIKFPRSTIESFLCGSYGYWYPEAKHWVVSRENNPETENLGIYQNPIIKIELLEKFDSIIDEREIPIISMIFSVGFTFWVALIMLVYELYKKRYKYFLLYMPLIILWLTTIASPVFCEYRYVYSLFTTLPVLIGLTFREEEIDG